MERRRGGANGEGDGGGEGWGEEKGMGWDYNSYVIFRFEVSRPTISIRNVD